MEALLCVACGLIAWACAWVLSAPAGSAVVGLRGAARLGRRILTSCSSSHVADALLVSGHVVDDVDMLCGLFFSGRQRPSRRECAGMVSLSSALVLVLGVLFTRSVLGGLVLLALFLVAIRCAAVALRDKEKRVLADEMPGVLRMLASALESGHTLMQAIDYVGLHEHGPAGKPFARAGMRLRCGASADEALSRLADELDAPGVGLMTTALSISQRTGSPLRDLLRRTAVLVERQREFERLLAVRTAQVRLSVRIVCGLPPLLVCLLSMISPDFRQGLLSRPGLTSVGLAAAMDVVAVLIMRKIMRGVL